MDLLKEVAKLKENIKQQVFDSDMTEQRLHVLKQENKVLAADLSRRMLENDEFKAEKEKLAVYQ